MPVAFSFIGPNSPPMGGWQSVTGITGATVTMVTRRGVTSVTPLRLAALRRLGIERDRDAPFLLAPYHGEGHPFSAGGR